MRRHRRAHLQLSFPAAFEAAHRKRQAQRASSLGDQPLERQHLPAVAAQAVGVQLVVVFVQSGECAEVDHRSRLRSQQAQGVTPSTGFQSWNRHSVVAMHPCLAPAG